MLLDQIDLADLDFFVNGDIHAAFRALRAESPVHWQERTPGRGFWSITRYEDVLACYRDPQSLSSALGVALYFSAPEPERSGMGRMMIMTDPPRHPKMRQVLSRRFTPRAVAPYEARIHDIVTAIIDSVSERGECDFVVDVAAKLPTATICEMMGIDREHWDLMFTIANQTIGHHDEEYTMGRGGRETFMEAQARAAEFLLEEAKRRRKNPSDDLISALVGGSVMGEPMPEAEIIANSFMLVLGGQETTRNATSGAMLALIENPGECAKFTANPCAPEAIEEFLRWTSPVTHVMRTATRDLELHGHKIRAGQRVVLWNASANRDELQFADPGRFDVARTPNDHIAFGYGEHFCLGASLARLQMRIMLEQVARRLPDMELAGPVERLRSNFVAGIKHMPVRFTPSATQSLAAN
jgi:cytochrome P450